MTLTAEGLLVGVGYFSVDVLLAQDGSVVSSQENDSLEESNNRLDNQWSSAEGDTFYLLQTDEQGAVNGLACLKVDGNNGIRPEKVLPFSQESYSYAYFSVLEDGTVYAADADGFFRCEAGDTNWQKLLDGMDTGFSLSDVWCRSIVALPDGSVYGWFGSESKDKLMAYCYDPEAVTEIAEELTLYTVEVGRDLKPEQMNSMEAIAQAVDGQKENYLGDHTCEELVDEFYQLISDGILQNRQIDRQQLRPWLENLKSIADNC